MAVTLTVSETLGGSAIADALAGGGTGADLGSVINGSFTPVISKTLNQGKQDLYIRHNATIDPITDVKTFIQQYGVGTGFTYGGAVSAAADYASIKSLGSASGSSKNNANGLSGGLWIEMDWDSNDTTRFDQATFPSNVKIYGDNGTDGQDLASAFALHTAALVYDAPGETSASAPVTGKIGKAADSVLGEAAHVALRLYLPTSYPDGGILQWEWVIAYSFTA